MVGQTILHYKILEKIGEGGMGVVYKAEDTKLERTVALKFLLLTSIGAEEKKRFKREAKAAAALNHPNITTIYNIEEVDDETFIVMEFIKGKELRDIVGAHRDAPMPIDDVLNYANQIAEGIQAAHEKDVTHRDIKSANIMITDKGQVKIMDFGLAKVRGGAQLTEEHSIIGTAAYMSPEQARGERVDHRTDIWSMAVVLYEMITGELPFKGDYQQAVLYSIVHEDPEPITGMRNDVPMELERIVGKAITKSPEERYQQIEEMLIDLKSVKKEFTSETWKERLSKTKSLSSIAVLPFVNMSADPENEYFSDGMAEEMINALTQLEDLRVAARTSSFAFKGKTTDISEVGHKLNVSTCWREAFGRLETDYELQPS